VIKKFDETCNGLVMINVSQDESNNTNKVKTAVGSISNMQQDKDEIIGSAMKSEVTRSEKKKLAITINARLGF